MTIITEPGIYPDVSESEYHADPVAGGSLSSTGARRILPPGCPAKFRHGQQHPTPPSTAMNFGSAAHTRVLGAGPQLAKVPAKDWRTKNAKMMRQVALAFDRIPVLPAEFSTVEAMADAIKAHPLASTLLDPDRGVPERTIVWQDETTGVWCRARLDWIPFGTRFFTDYKTAISAEQESFGRSVYTYGYHQQAAWYLDGVQALGLADTDAAFLFIVQEKDPPYLVTVNELDATALEVGRARNRWARTVYAECVKAEKWPGYSDDVSQISLPQWALKREGVA